MASITQDVTETFINNSCNVLPAWVDGAVSMGHDWKLSHIGYSYVNEVTCSFEATVGATARCVISSIPRGLVDNVSTGFAYANVTKDAAIEHGKECFSLCQSFIPEELPKYCAERAADAIHPITEMTGTDFVIATISGSIIGVVVYAALSLGNRTNPR